MSYSNKTWMILRNGSRDATIPANFYMHLRLQTLSNYFVIRKTDLLVNHCKRWFLKCYCTQNNLVVAQGDRPNLLENFLTPCFNHKRSKRSLSFTRLSLTPLPIHANNELTGTDKISDWKRFAHFEF